jgi:hypothetical protein
MHLDSTILSLVMIWRTLSSTIHTPDGSLDVVHIVRNEYYSMSATAEASHYVIFFPSIDT